LFDNIDHDWLTAHIPLDRVVLRKWLKAGFMDKHTLYPTETGTPQGGIITPPTMLQTLGIFFGGER
jgi:RNA-directed DNA polymerase